VKNKHGHPVGVGARRRFKAIDGKDVFVTIEDEVYRPQKSGPHKKLIYLQKLCFENDNHTEYRFTYYMEGQKGKTKGSWVFGQYSLVVPAEDLRWLLKEARKKKWPGF
jgi:hypothetical protein